MRIKFGTSGWRGIISEDFTFDNVRLLSQAVANYLKRIKKAKRGIIVAYDTRFLSKDFASEAAKVLSSNNIDVYLSKGPTPTPVVAYNIIDKKTAGAIIISASHNPPEYNGFKFSSEYGGPSLKEVTDKVEKEVRNLNLRDIKLDERKAKKRIELFNPAPPYLRQLEKVLDLKLMKRARMKIAIDCMNGIISGYLDKILAKLKYEIDVINCEEDPFFNGRNPDPLPENLKELIKKVKKEEFDLGLTVDGDSDRFGIIDNRGSFIIPNQIIGLVFYYLVKTRKRRPIVARSISTTHLVDEIAKDHGIEVEETPIGFKHIGKLLITGDYIFGAEESGGLSIGGHVPEKDGILADLLVVEAISYFKKSIKEILDGIYKKYGRFYNKRINIEIDKPKGIKFMERISKNPPERIIGLKVVEINQLDGCKFILENGDWLMFRMSGTEPVMRCYFESRSKKGFSNLMNEAKRMINSIS